MSEFVDENSILLEEKPLEGQGDHVLRLIQIKGEKNNVRLCLSVRGQIASTVFGGSIAFEIKSEEARHYFEQIKTMDQFHERSERIHKAIVDMLKS